jgi:hypothetical protein
MLAAWRAGGLLAGYIQVQAVLADVMLCCAVLWCAAQIGTVPIYAGLTVGGVLATSAHGTGD